MYRKTHIYSEHFLNFKEIYRTEIHKKPIHFLDTNGVSARKEFLQIRPKYLSFMCGQKMKPKRIPEKSKLT